MKAVSLVIPFYNAADTLPALLAAIERQTLPAGDFEVIMVDDGSTDFSADLVRRHSRARLLSQPNRGPGAARNHGTRHACGEIVVYCDADCVPLPDFLAGHARLHLEHSDLAGLCGSVVPAAPLPLGSPVLADHLCSWFNAHDRLPPRQPEYMWGANMSVKRRVIDGGIRWSEERTTGEDVDFSLKIKARGGRLGFFPECSIGHHDRATLRGFFRHQYNWGFHAPFVRGRDPTAKYHWLFPASVVGAVLCAPCLVAGYAALTVRAWWRVRPLALASSLPLILLGKLAYARGVLDGTRAMITEASGVVADRRAV